MFSSGVSNKPRFFSKRTSEFFGPGAEVGIRGEQGAFKLFIFIEGQDIIGEAGGEFLFGLLVVRVHHLLIALHEEESQFRRVFAASDLVEDRAAQKGVGLHVSANPVFREAFLLDRFTRPQPALCPAIVQNRRRIVLLPECHGADPDERLVFQGLRVEIPVETDGFVDEEREKVDENDDEHQNGSPEENPLPVRFRFRVRCHVRLLTWEGDCSFGSGTPSPPGRDCFR